MGDKALIRELDRYPYYGLIPICQALSIPSNRSFSLRVGLFYPGLMTMAYHYSFRTRLKDHKNMKHRGG